MRIGSLMAGASLALAMSALSGPALAQGQGQGKGRSADAAAQGQGKGKSGELVAMKQAQGKGQAGGQGQGQGQAKGQGASQAPGQAQRAQPPGQQRATAAVAGSRGRFARQVALSEVPTSVRQFASSNRRPQVVAAGALARAHARGVRDEFRLVPTGDRVSILNRQGDVLLLLDEDRARNLGRWDVNVINPQLSSGAPSFCRSGAGHPVWGRQWCLDKGFGLGDFDDVRWGRTTTLGDIIFGRTATTGNLSGDVLLGLVGDTAFDRLALHALTLGYTAPLTGVWATEPSGRRVLLVNSGPAPVAEIVDVNSDNRADLMLVALRPWL